MTESHEVNTGVGSRYHSFFEAIVQHATHHIKAKFSTFFELFQLEFFLRRNGTVRALAVELDYARVACPDLQGWTNPDPGLSHHFSQIGIEMQPVIGFEELSVFY